MNRELKFRVWNGFEMEYNVTVGKFGNFYVNPENGDGLNLKDTASLTTCTTKYLDDTPTMQYTGIKDINNNDIYEGDIVSFKFWRDALQRMENRKMKVEYLNGFFYPLVSFGGGPSNKDYEIVGNVFENPELLINS